jgi:hypothetical protein
MKDVCFVSVCFGDPRYYYQLDRLKASILCFYPEANFLFYRGEYPPNSRTFFESLYGFKPHAIKVAKDQGYKKVIWLDPAMILIDTIDDLMKFEMMAVKDDNVLYDKVSNVCYKYFGLTQKEVYDRDYHLVGGSIYTFDFEKESANQIFNRWLDAEKMRMFGSQTEQASEQLQGHRMDEAVMALAMYEAGIEPTSPEDARYCWVENPMFIKKHFK